MRIDRKAMTYASPMVPWGGTTAFIVVLACFPPVAAGGPPDELGAEPGQARAASRFAASLRGEAGVRGAIDAVCQSEDRLRRDVAVTVLVLRAADALPMLLDAVVDASVLLLRRSTRNPIASIPTPTATNALP